MPQLTKDDLEIDRLNAAISEATATFEAKARRVSELAEELSKLQAGYTPEGRVTRRQAVRMAVLAGDKGRAQSLVDRYVQEVGINEQMRFELRSLVQDTGCSYPE